MDPQVASTLLTVAAVLIGALIGAVTNLAIARSRERADARAAARMVEDELRGLLGALSRVVWLADFHLLSRPIDEQWRGHKLALGRRVTTEEWRTIVMAYSLADYVGQESPAHDEGSQHRVAVNAQDRVRQALRVVYRYAEPSADIEKYLTTLREEDVDMPPGEEAL